MVGAEQGALPIRVVELAGAIGAGKTALRPALERALAEHGLQPLQGAAGMDRLLGRTRAGRLLRPILARRRGAGLARALVDIRWGYGSLVIRPRRGASVLAGLLGAPIPWWHRRRILRLWIEATGRVDFSRPRLRNDEVLIIDEGPIHRAVNLFAWDPTPDLPAVERYLRRSARPDLVVLVDASPAIARDRLADRGLPKRLRDRDEAAVDGFLDRARIVLQATGSWLERAGVPVVTVANDGSLDAAAATLAAGLERALVGDGTPGHHPARGRRDLPAFRPRLGSRLPRPRRPGMSSRGGPALDDPTISSVLAAFGIRATATSRPAPGGGRGTSVIVPTERGVLLLKRYKATVDRDAVRGEHAILRRLEEVDFPAPRLVASPDGETLLERPDGAFALFGYLDGYHRADARLLAPGDARALVELAGATLAVLHASLADFMPPTVSPNGFRSADGPRVRDLAWYMTRLEDARAAAALTLPDDPARVIVDRGGQVAEELARLDGTLAAANLTRLVVHGDYGPYNLLVRPGRPLVVIDHELARRDWRLTDLATALPRFAAGRRGSPVDRAIAFATGYLERCTIPPSELDNLPAVGAYLALRRTVVCWARWAETTDRHWLTEAREKMDLARAHGDEREPLTAVATATARA